MRKVLGSAVDDIAVSATKSMHGHLLGGTGAIESVATVLAIKHRLAPPTINVEKLDPEVTVDVVRDKPRELPQGPMVALNDSFGFGGHNVVVAFRSV
jgi:3-oxoacyl-[acyl-carrier-protein] synthase II